MRKKNRSEPLNIHESFSDIALLMLATFIFLLVTILITSKLAEEIQVPKLKKEVTSLKKRLQTLEEERKRLTQDMNELVMSPDAQMDKAERIVIDSFKIGRPP